MDLLLHLATIALTWFIAFNSSLALIFGAPLAHPPFLAAKPNTHELSLTQIPSVRETIPDILIRNSKYQEASVVDSIDPETAPAQALDALVNIYCTITTDTYTKTTTGTGFIIDTDGVVLTNAHVAQFLLLEGILGDAHCTIRTGNPAAASYQAELLYISPAWILENAKLINDVTPKGTGERDYALLYITGAVDGKPMPAHFPALPFDVTPLGERALHESVLATGYPAEAMLEEGVNAPLSPKQATTTIAELMTFGSDTVDLVTIGGTAIGEHGSSGGPIVDADGKAIGIISTRGEDAQFGTGSLRAITIPYIDRTIKEETGFTLRQSLGGNLPYRAQIFKETIVPLLQTALKQQL